jgi:hypothetical protein
LEKRYLQVLADLMSDGPLVPLLTRFRPENDMPSAGRALGSTTLGLIAIQTDNHSKLALGQGDGINRRARDSRRPQEFCDCTINRSGDLIAWKVVSHVYKCTH